MWQLTERHRQIFLDCLDLTLREVGKKHDLSPERARQVQRRVARALCRQHELSSLDWPYTIKEFRQQRSLWVERASKMPVFVPGRYELRVEQNEMRVTFRFDHKSQLTWAARLLRPSVDSFEMYRRLGEGWERLSDHV